MFWKEDDEENCKICIMNFESRVHSADTFTTSADANNITNTTDTGNADIFNNSKQNNYSI